MMVFEGAGEKTPSLDGNGPAPEPAGDAHSHDVAEVTTSALNLGNMHELDEKVEERGVSLPFLQHWMNEIKRALGVAAASKADCYHVVGLQDLKSGAKLMKPPAWSILARTSASERSLVETMKEAARETGDQTLVCDANNNEYFGRPTHFISHTWASTYSAMVLSITDQVNAERPNEPVFFWIDIFCVSQNSATASAKLRKKKDLCRMDDGYPINACSATWMLAEPWSNPSAFGRVWCINECFMAANKQDMGSFQLMLPADQRSAFETSLTQNFDQLSQTMGKIDMEKADAWDPADKERIFARIRAEGGFTGLNQIVAGCLREWLVRVGRNAVDNLPSSERGLSSLILPCGNLLYSLDHFEDAEKYYRLAYDAGVKEYTVQKEHTLLAMYGLGNLYRRLERYSEAEPFYRKIFSVRHEEDGPEAPETMGATVNLAYFLLCSGSLEESEALYQKTLEWAGKYYQGPHKDWFRLLASYATLLRLKRDFDTAEKYCVKALHGREDLLGERHSDTLISRVEYGKLMHDQGKLGCAEKIFLAAFEDSKVTHGVNHRKTQELQEDMRKLQEDMRKLHAALSAS